MTRLNSNFKENFCSNHKVVKYAVAQFLPQSLYFETRAQPGIKMLNYTTRTFRSSLTTRRRTNTRTTDNAPRNYLGLGRQDRFFFSKGGNSRILSQEVLRSVLFLLRRRVSSRRYLLLLICRCVSFVFNNHVFR